MMGGDPGPTNYYLCRTLIGVHSTMHLMHPNEGLAIITCIAIFLHVGSQPRNYMNNISALPGSTLPASDMPSFPAEYDDVGMDKASE